MNYKILASEGHDMTAKSPSWKPNEDLAVGKGATVQQFVATVGADRLEIDIAPWGEGALRVNGVEIAQVSNLKNRREAFRELNKLAERYVRTHQTPKTRSPVVA